MSLLFEVTELDFKLSVENSGFLDETWTIPVSESGVPHPCYRGMLITQG